MISLRTTCRRGKIFQQSSVYFKLTILLKDSAFLYRRQALCVCMPLLIYSIDVAVCTICTKHKAQRVTEKLI